MKKVIFLLAVYCLLQIEAASINKTADKNETNSTATNNVDNRNETSSATTKVDKRNETSSSTNQVNKRNETTVVFNFNLPNNTYYYSVETPEETVKYESSHINTDSAGKDHIVVKGGYEVNTKDLYYVVTYVADDKGYRPQVKVNFGTNVEIGTRIGPGKKPSAGPKGIDPTLMCSLIGGGCK